MFNKLPPELFLEVFSWLPVQETFKIRLVSKRWKASVDQLKIENLILLSKKIYKKTSLLNSSDSVIVNDEDLLIRTILLDVKFKKLKKLTVSLGADYLVKPSEFYNYFTELEYLKFQHAYHWYGRDYYKIILSLQKLKWLESKSFVDLLKLETPQLVYLKINSLYLVENFGEISKSLKVLNLFNTPDDDEAARLLELSNLERLVLGYWDPVFFHSYLPRLASLKEVYINTIRNPLHPLNRLTSYSRDGLKIFLRGFPLDDFIQIANEEDDDYNHEYHLKSYTLKYLIDNYDRIDKLKGRFKLDYYELISLAGKVPKNFISKVPKTCAIEVAEKINDEPSLLDFIETSKIKMLRIKDRCKQLSSTFFVGLIKKGRHVEQLYIGKQQKIKSNLDSIMKMKSLNNLEINKKLSFDDILKFMRSTKAIISCHINLVGDHENLCTFSMDSSSYHKLNHESYYESCLYFSIKHSTVDRRLEYDDDAYYSDDREFYISKSIKCLSLDFKPLFIEFIERAKQEFLKPKDNNDNRRFIYFVEQFKYEKFIEDCMIKKLARKQLIFI